MTVVNHGVPISVPPPVVIHDRHHHSHGLGHAIGHALTGTKHHSHHQTVVVPPPVYVPPPVHVHPRPLHAVGVCPPTLRAPVAHGVVHGTPVHGVPSAPVYYPH